MQGLGQALMERTVYDDAGQLVTGSYMDYQLPRAADAPFFAFESRPVPATTNPLGAKGCGEAGCAGSLPAVMNALADALASRHQARRHAGDPAGGLGGDPGGALKSLSRSATALIHLLAESAFPTRVPCGGGQGGGRRA